MAKRGETKEKILAAATKVFLANGYEATSVKMVLEEADIVTGSFYHFFKSKEALFEAVTERFLDDYTNSVGNILMNDSLTTDEVFERFLNHFEKTNKTYYEVLQGDRLHWTVQGALHERTVHAMIGQMAVFLEEREKRGRLKKKINEDPETLANIIIRGFEAIIHGKNAPKNKDELRTRLRAFWENFYSET